MEASLDHRTKTSEDESSFTSEVDTDVEDAAEAGLKVRTRHQFSDDIVPVPTKAEDVDGEPTENTVYLDKYGGAIEDLNISKFLNSVPYDASKNGGTEVETVANAGGEVTKVKSKQIEEEVTEEEVVELEFEKAIPKLDTHSMHCPNCDHQITKVVLRRKIIKQKSVPIVEKRDDLLGCFSCFSLFAPSGDGGCNPFPLFWNKSDPSAVPASGVVTNNENCFSMFRVRREKNSPIPNQVDPASKQPTQEKVDPTSNLDHSSPRAIEINDIMNKLPIRQGKQNTEGEPSKLENQPPTVSVPPPHDQSPVDVKPSENGESIIDITPGTSSATQVPTQRSTAAQDSTSFEILKSIVYGGLMEVIASLSIVASAAAGDATTLNIVALALANLIGGIFVIGHNLWDLKDDCYKFSTQEPSNQESRNKYKELLGSVEHFPMHAFFVILSFLVFGIIPPVAYGYSFHETNDKDFTMVIVAIASFVCVGLLAIFKAYIDRCGGFLGYVKTITYYLTTAVTVSGVSYVVGNLASRLIAESGWFETGSDVAIAVLPEVVSTNPSLAYY